MARNAERAAPVTGLRRWLLHHRMAARDVALQLRRERLSTLLVAVTLAVALALPGLLHVASERLADLAARWETTPRLNVFLLGDDAEARAQALTDWAEIESVAFQSARESLGELAEMGGQAELLTELEGAFEGNPLPAVAVVTPVPDSAVPARLHALAERLRASEAVDGVQVELEWLQRLQAALALIDRLVWVVGLLLALAVLLVVGSLTRMTVAQREDEIRVQKLVGGSSAFVLRPFLYQGATLGLMAGVLACLLVVITLMMLDNAVAELARRYGSDYRLGGVPPTAALGLVVAGTGLGWLGAWLAGWRQLQRIEP